MTKEYYEEILDMILSDTEKRLDKMVEGVSELKFGRLPKLGYNEKYLVKFDIDKLSPSIIKHCQDRLVDIFGEDNVVFIPDGIDISIIEL